MLLLLQKLYSMAEFKYNRIKIALVEHDRTNVWLAEHMGESTMTINRWASNKSQPSIEQLVEISKLLYMDVRELLTPTK